MTDEKESKRSLVAFILISAFCALWLMSALLMRNSLDDQYSWQAQSFLRGRLDIPIETISAAGGSVEDMVISGGRLYWPLGPLPAVLLIPLVAAVGIAISQPALQLVAVLGVVVAAYVLARRSGLSAGAGRWSALAFAFASVFIGVAGMLGPWYLAQVLAVLFVLLGLIEYRGKDRPWLVGILCALTVACRPVAGAALAGFYGFVTLSKFGLTRKLLARLAQFAAPLLAAAGLLGWYNAARFGSPFDNGYRQSLLSTNLSWLAERRSTTGLFHWSYIPLNFYNYFLRLPGWRGILPVANPYGLSVFLISPIFLRLAALRRLNWEKLAALGVSAAAIVMLLAYYTTGFTQFGPRYLCDILPLLFLVLVAVFKEKGMGAISKTIIGTSAFVNIVLMVLFVVGLRFGALL